MIFKTASRVIKKKSSWVAQNKYEAKGMKKEVKEKPYHPEGEAKYVLSLKFGSKLLKTDESEVLSRLHNARNTNSCLEMQPLLCYWKEQKISLIMGWEEASKR